MTKIIEIEGIGETYAAALTGAGVATVEALLDTAGAAEGRGALAGETGGTPPRGLQGGDRAGPRCAAAGPASQLPMR